MFGDTDNPGPGSSSPTKTFAELELARLSEECERTKEDLKCFAYAASHDLQTPLRTIATHLQLLERRLGSRMSREDLDLLRFPVQAALRMSQLIKDLLAYSEIGTERRDPAPVSSEEALAGALEDLAANIEESRAIVTHDSLPTLQGSFTQLRRLFFDLVSNAIQYRSHAAPKIHIGARRECSAWHFTVCDNGIGIPAEHRDEIFKLFKRLHGHDSPGSGLGLCIAKRIVERFGGRIWVDSRVGVGSTFHFTVPDRQPPVLRLSADDCQ